MLNIITIIAYSELLAIFILILYLRKSTKNKNNLIREHDAIYDFVHDVSDTFVQTDQPHLNYLLERILYYGKQTTKANTAAIYFLEPDNITLKIRVVSGMFPPLIDGIEEPLDTKGNKFQYLENLAKKQIVRVGQGLIGRVAETGEAVLIEDAERDRRVRRFKSVFLQIDSMLIIPMRFQSKVIGVFVAVNRIDEMPFKQADLYLLQALADQASAIIYFAKQSAQLQKKRLIDNDLKIAKRIQKALLPRQIPSVKNLDLAVFSIPAREIGGDYYDFINIDSEHIGVLIADAAGKGISGAIFMSVCRSAFRTIAPNNLSPADVLKKANHIILNEIYEDTFVSMIYLIVNVNDMTIKIARAGHTIPFIFSADNEQYTDLDIKGMALGIVDGVTFDNQLEENTITLNKNHTLVLYTDGICEARNNDAEEWGLENLKKSIKFFKNELAEEMVNNLRQRITDFIGSTGQYDDMTLLVLKNKQTENTDKTLKV
jgi:phosphoserine phosphatase RsbU/P